MPRADDLIDVRRHGDVRDQPARRCAEPLGDRLDLGIPIDERDARPLAEQPLRDQEPDPPGRARDQRRSSLECIVGGLPLRPECV